MKNDTCPKCGSAEVLVDVKVRDPYPLRAKVEAAPPPDRGFLWTPQTATSDIRAWICSQCGFTELYTDNLEEPHKVYQLR